MSDRAPRIGVVTFPGSLDDRDALRAVALMGGEAVPLWHADRDLQGVDAVILPGGFSYGDYLRCGAIARFAPVMDEVAASPTRGGPVLGICNGFQILCEAGLLPGALIRNRSLRFVCRDVYLRVETAQTAVTAGLAARRDARDPDQARRGPVRRRRGRARPVEGEGLVVFRYARPTASSTTPTTRTARTNNIAGVRNAAGNVVGLMPHPEHAVDPDVGPTGGQPLFASLLPAALARCGR